jgi:general secretion pathway protein D
MQPVSRATRLVLVGSAADLEIAKSIIADTDVPQPMVRIEAGLYEVAEESIDDTGFAPAVSGEISFTVPAGTGVSLPAGQVGRKATSITSTLKALVTSKKAKLLAEPNISAINNEDASIFIGDLIRFRGSTFTPGNGGAVQGVDAIPIGIALLLRPRIHPDGQVTLKVHPVVSAATSSNADGLPQTSSREADTTVRLRPGEELVIGGLDRVERQTNVQRIPLLSETPWIGNLFRSRTERSNKNRIVVVIRAYPLTVDRAPDKSFPLQEGKP